MLLHHSATELCLSVIKHGTAVESSFSEDMGGQHRQQMQQLCSLVTATEILLKRIVFITMCGMGRLCC